MSRLSTSFVLGYHGCEKSIGLDVINGKSALIRSFNDYDWLGSGVYFWESDPLRALEWSQKQVTLGKYSEPFVIGAVIDLRNCLDLLSREDIEQLRAAHDAFLKVQSISGLPMPINKNVSTQSHLDRTLRYLDCAVIKHLHKILDDKGKELGIEPFNTVRGMFSEGKEIYPSSGFKSHSHIQIAVRDLNCIKGLFIPRPYPDVLK